MVCKKCIHYCILIDEILSEMDENDMDIMEWDRKFEQIKRNVVLR